MRTGTGSFMVILIVALVLGHPGRARADETDNFTCRNRLSQDALGALDDLMNARIREAIDRANHHEGGNCDASCLLRELQERIGASYPSPVTLVPHSRFARWISERPDVERCHLKFRESIYGARPYDQPWLFPFTGRIIFIADSILVSGRVIGIDKFNHFIREGLSHWRAIDRGSDIRSGLKRELGPPRRQFRWTEYGLKGMSMTGVLAYSDLAAGYFGYQFWNDLLSLGRTQSFVTYDPAGRQFTQQRAFSFAAYVNDAWDEGINCSTLHPTLAKEVATALRRRSMTCPVSDCATLTGLPDADLYVNPACLREETPY